MGRDDNNRDKDRIKPTVLHVVFTDGSCHQFDVDTLVLAQAILQIFQTGGSGRVNADPNTVIDLSKVSAMSIGDKCR